MAERLTTRSMEATLGAAGANNVPTPDLDDQGGRTWPRSQTV